MRNVIQRRINPCEAYSGRLAGRTIGYRFPGLLADHLSDAGADLELVSEPPAIHSA
ncbi:MAG: hypothetical protein AAFY26_20490 [Cyanobacteria bacterium J06638_22]